MKGVLDQEWRGPVRLDGGLWRAGQDVRWTGVDGQGHYGQIESLTDTRASVRCGYAIVGFMRGDSVLVPAVDLEGREVA